MTIMERVRPLQAKGSQPKLQELVGFNNLPNQFQLQLPQSQRWSAWGVGVGKSSFVVEPKTRLMTLSFPEHFPANKIKNASPPLFI